MIPSFKHLFVTLSFVLLVGNTQAQSGVVDVIDGNAQPYFYYGITSYYYFGYNQYLYTPAQIRNNGPISAIQLHSNVDLNPINPYHPLPSIPMILQFRKPNPLKNP